MSLTLRLKMRHRATIQRDMAIGQNPRGGPASPEYRDHLVGQPCLFWEEASAQPGVERPERRIVVLDARLRVPAGTDVRAGDRVTEIRDRQGKVLRTATMRVSHIIRRGRDLVCFLEALDATNVARE